MSYIRRTNDEIEEQIKLSCSLLQEMGNEGFTVPDNMAKVNYLSLRTTIRTLLWSLGYDFDEITAMIANFDKGGDLFWT